MVALKTERQIFLWHLNSYTMPNEAPVSATLEEVLEIIEAAHENKTARLYLSSDSAALEDTASATEIDPKNCIYISDIKSDDTKGIKTILINRGDPDATNASFIKAASDAVRHVSPEQGEMPGWSAHLVLSTRLKKGNSYRAGFERMQNVPSSLVHKLFDRILERHTTENPRYFYDKPVKKGRKVVIERRPYSIRFGIKRSPSEQIIKDLEKGELAQIQLIQENPKYNGPGAPSVVKSAKNVLIIKTKHVDKTTLTDYVKNLTKWAKTQNYDEIQFTMRSLPGNKTSSPRFKIEQADAMEALYVRSQRLTAFDSLLECCYQKVFPEIEAKITGLLTDESKWRK